jgi:hypothetical protein
MIPTIAFFERCDNPANAVAMKPLLFDSATGTTCVEDAVDEATVDGVVDAAEITCPTFAGSVMPFPEVFVGS